MDNLLLLKEFDASNLVMSHLQRLARFFKVLHTRTHTHTHTHRTPYIHIGAPMHQRTHSRARTHTHASTPRVYPYNEACTCEQARNQQKH